MTFKDILFHIDSYPEATSEAAIDQAVGFVAALGGRVTALALAVRIPLHSNRLADYLLKLTERPGGGEPEPVRVRRPAGPLRGKG